MGWIWVRTSQSESVDSLQFMESMESDFVDGGSRIIFKSVVLHVGGTSSYPFLSLEHFYVKALKVQQLGTQHVLLTIGNY